MAGVWDSGERDVCSMLLLVAIIDEMPSNNKPQFPSR
jgi:hypothetical protein